MSQTGGQKYSDTSPFSIPWLDRWTDEQIDIEQTDRATDGDRGRQEDWKEGKYYEDVVLKISLSVVKIQIN